MPSVVGAIDGTHIRIKAPAGEEWVFINRKGEHTINVQVLVYQLLKRSIKFIFIVPAITFQLHNRQFKFILSH